MALKTQCHSGYVVTTSTLWDCGSGMTGVTFGLLIVRALFRPHLDTSKIPTETQSHGFDGPWAPCDLEAVFLYMSGISSVLSGCIF